MHKLVREAMKVYSQFQVKGPTYLDTFDTRAIVEATMEAIKTKPLQEYIRREFRPQGEISMLPIHQEPDHKFTIALFALVGGIKMPLHDHPNMFVLTHVMSGQGEREAWDIAEEEQPGMMEFRTSKAESKIVRAIKHPFIPLNEGDNCFTTPNKNNLHRFTNKSDSELFVFLDVILPHYNEIDRVISFYEPTSSTHLEVNSSPKQYKRHPIKDIDVRDFLIQ